MKSHLKNIIFSRRTAGVVLVSAFAILAVWGANLSMMTHKAGEMMPSCPLVSATEQPCAMTISAHLTYWQQLLLSMPEKMGTETILGIFALLIGIFTIKFFGNFTFAFRRAVIPRDGPPGGYFDYRYSSIGNGIVHKRE